MNPNTQEKYKQNIYQYLIFKKDEHHKILHYLKWLFYLFILFLFLPWTQNFRAKGYVTSLDQTSRSQTLQSTIEGKIEKWYFKEGDFVKKGDTILKLSEIKTEYFDPKLLKRVSEQIIAKENAISSYERKIKALNNQIDALIKIRDLKKQQISLKINQVKLKLVADSNEWLSAQQNLNASKKQYERMEELYKQGLKSLTDLENRKVKYAESQAKEISAFNKYQSTLNDYYAAQVELNNIENEYNEKIFKAESDKLSAMSALMEAQSELLKLQTNSANYTMRANNYYVVAPQDCYILKTLKTGIGEIVYPSDPIVNIMPANYRIGVEMYVKPLDVNLLAKGSKIRIQFDGWPAIVFSGWPTVSYGTFGGKVYSIDKFISPNGMYRVLVEPDSSDHPWPKDLYVGGGANCLALLKTVPIWYEIWRQINGFPPDFYINADTQKENIQKIKIKQDKK